MALMNHSAQQRHYLDGVRFWGFVFIECISVRVRDGDRSLESTWGLSHWKMFGTCLPLYCSAAFANNSLMSCQSSYVHTCPVRCFPWAVDEELDILRRSRSEITESLSSSSGGELEDGGEGSAEEEEEEGEEGEEVGTETDSTFSDVKGRWFCKTPVELAVTLCLLRRRCGAGRDWDWQLVEGRCVEV